MRTNLLATLLAVACLSAGCTGPGAEAPTAAPLPLEPTATQAPPTLAEPTAPVTAGEARMTGTRVFVIDPDQSTVRYEVGETFLREGNRFNLAIGTTNTLNGEITLDYDRPANSRIGTLTVDISTFRSDSDRRDRRIQEEWLESARFPIVTVQPTTIIGLTDEARAGEEVRFQVVATTTIRDVTRPLTYDVSAKVTGDRLTATATTQLKMTDFGFQPPDIAGVLKAEDDVKVTIELVARPKDG